MPYDYEAAQQTANDMITEYGGPAILRRKTGDRDCIAVVIDENPSEHQGKPINAVDRIALISALDPDGAQLDPPPVFQVDTLVILNADGDESEVLRITEPVARLKPAATVVYYEAHVRA